MALLNRLFVRIKFCNIRNSSTVAQALPFEEEPRHSFRTIEDNPANHTIRHVNRFYTIPEKEYKVLKTHAFPPDFEKQIKTFNECSILIRKSALELLDYLHRTDYSKPVNKYVIYGQLGCGKSLVLIHALHYGYKTNKILVHIPWAKGWFEFPKEVVSKDDLIDLPLDAAAWLANFKSQNASLLKNIGLNLSQAYEWGPNESSAKNTPLIEMIDFGISRIKYASDVLKVLIKELKQACTQGKCQVFVLIDGYNAFFSNHSNIKDDSKKMVPPSKVTLTEAFLDLTKSDWCNGQIVLGVDKIATKHRRDSDFPRYLLSEKGFDHLDPFLPILIENYNQDEFDAVIEYYKDRKWIRSITPEGQKELKLISGCNAAKLMDYCKHL